MITPEIVHFVGVDVAIDGHARQRCAWCGALLLEYDLARLAVPVGQEGGPAFWPIGSLLAAAGDASWVLAVEDATKINDATDGRDCASIDHEVTR